MLRLTSRLFLTNMRRHTLTGSETQHMHALSLKASQVADIFHFCAYKVIIIILVGVTEQGSIHCNCQPPINIPLLQGNPRSSRDLQFTQLTSMWTKPAILSLSLFPRLLSPYPCSSFSYHFTTWSATTMCPWHLFFCFLSLSSLISSHLPSSPMISYTYLSILFDLPSFLSNVHLLSLFFFLSPLIEVVVTRWTDFNGLLWKLWRAMGWG